MTARQWIDMVEFYSGSSGGRGLKCALGFLADYYNPTAPANKRVPIREIVDRLREKNKRLVLPAKLMKLK